MPFAPRHRFDWYLRTRSLPLGQRTFSMGILNVTPDSFSDGGHFYTPQEAPDRAVAQALQMLDEGADILDIGGESTRPNATPLLADEEQARVLPVIEAILKARPGIILSIDTFHAATAQRAIEAGAEIVNDVSGHLWDPAMSATCAELGCGVVLMHTRGRPEEWRTLAHLPHNEILSMVLEGLRKRLQAATTAGIARDRIVLDPGFGFGKRLDDNYPLLAQLDQLHQLNLPLLIGASRKGFLGHTLSQLPNPTDPPQDPGAPQPTLSLSKGPDLLTWVPPHQRLHATIAANVSAILSGAHILRVHDVRPAVEAAAIADAILNHASFG